MSERQLMLPLCRPVPCTARSGLSGTPQMTRSNWFKPVQTGSDRSRLVPNVIKYYVFLNLCIFFRGGGERVREPKDLIARHNDYDIVGLAMDISVD